MATVRYGLSRGETEFQVTEAVGAATATDNIEITVDQAVSLTKSEVLQAIDMLKNHMLKNATGALKDGN